MKIIFDFDGTIHKSDEIYEKAFYDTLKKYKIKKPADFSTDFLS